jgi:hypothetical protein
MLRSLWDALLCQPQPALSVHTFDCHSDDFEKYLTSRFNSRNRIGTTLLSILNTRPQKGYSQIDPFFIFLVRVSLSLICVSFGPNVMGYLPLAVRLLGNRRHMLGQSQLVVARCVRTNRA